MSNPESPLKVGELLIKEGYLTPDLLTRLLEEQKAQSQLSSRKAYKPLGQMCIERKLISAEELQKVLKKHNKRIRLGELMINMNMIQESQLDAALSLQKKSLGMKLGELLVEAGHITEQQLVEALSLQLDIPRMFPALELLDSRLMERFELRYLEDELCIPMLQDFRGLTVVMANPLDENVREALQQQAEITIVPALAPASVIRDVLAEYQGKRQDTFSLGTASMYDTSGAPAAESTPQVGGVNVYTDADQRRQEDKVVHFLLKSALKDRADNIHIEPLENSLRIRYRIDGVLHHKTDLPQDLAGPLVKRLKELCGLNTAQERHPQRNRVKANLLEQEMELSMATFPCHWGEIVALSIKAQQSETYERLFNLDRIGFSPLYLRRFQQQLQQPGGLLIMTGPARSGKTTSLYASIRYLNEQNRSILTAENPVEHLITGTQQSSWDANSDGSYAEHIQAMGHLDPDILMVSDISSAASLQATVALALSGAKVLTAFPAFDATGALLRLSKMGLEDYLIASSHITVLSQRLVRRLCNACKLPHTPHPDIFHQLGLVDVDPATLQFWGPRGCEQCQQRGYQGLIAIHELLALNEAIREAVLDHKPAATIRGIARTEAKLVSMAEDGFYKAIEGITSIEEIQRMAFVNEYDAQTPWEAEEIRSICAGLEPEFL